MHKIPWYCNMFFLRPPECSIHSCSVPRFFTVLVWLQGASAALQRSSVMLSQSVLFIKVLIQLHWCFHSEKKREPKRTKHTQSQSWSRYQIRLVLIDFSLYMDDHHEGICHCSSSNCSWWLSKHKLHFIKMSEFQVRRA